MKTAKARSTFTGRALAASLVLFGMAATPSFAATLAHRWSFNGNLDDSVGGANATTIGTSSTVNYVDGNTAVQTGSDQAGTYATSLKLGIGLVTGGTVTIEAWAKRIKLDAAYANMRLFDWGPDTTAYFCLSWNDNADIWVKSGNGNRTGSPYTTVSDSGCWANGKKYYVAVTLTANGDGTTTAHIVRYDTANLTDFESADTTFSSCDLASILAGNLYLGHSQWPGESGKDATAVYDEVRVWEGGLSRAQMAKNAADGPDTIDMLPLAHRWSFNGNLDDSVGGVTAEPVQSKNVDNGVVIPSPVPVKYVNDDTAVQTGADQYGTYATSLNLGTGLVTGNDVTLEIWATRRSIQDNARMFDWGTGGYNADPSFYVCLPWHAWGAEQAMIWTRGGGGQTSSAIANCFANNTKYHIAFTVTQDGTSSKYHLVRRNVDDLSDKASLPSDHTVTAWTLSNVVGGRLYLGHSQWVGERDLDANAIYDEVRIYPQVVPDQLLALNAAMGPDTLVLSFDEKGNANINIPANTTLPVNANTLGSGFTIGGKVTFATGAKIAFDTANYPDGMSFTAEGGFVVPSGDVADYVTHTASGDYVVSLQGNTLIVAPSTATSWTGEAGDGNWNNAANWTKGVPTADSEVTILSTATSMPQATGACRSLTVAGGTLAADCDWSGLAVKPVISGTVNLNGHNLTMPSIGITAQSGAAFSNSAATTNEVTNEVRFLANGSTVTATEATFIDGIANLTTAANAKIALVHSSGDSSGTLNVGAANNHTVFRAESGTISMTENGNVGMTSGGVGYLDVAGGTVDFCTANDRGISLGGANARAIVTISGGKLRANWIDAGHNDVTECTIVQTGGEVETGINNNGNLWLGRNPRGKATYALSNGSINVTKGTLDVGNYGTAIFTQDGGAVTIAASDLRVGQNSGATGTYTLNSGTITPKFWLIVGKYGTGTFTQNGGILTLNAGDSADGNWVNIAQYAGSQGTYTIQNGTLEVGTGTMGGGIFMGEEGGTGTFAMNGGTVITPTITSIRADSTVKLNGGTIKVAKDGGETSSRHASDIGIIKNVGNLVFGSTATTIDTDGHNTKIVGCGYDTIPGSSLVKTGAGTLTAAMPPVETLIVSNGVLALSAAADNSKPLAALAHRWSFTDGSLADSEGGAPDATTIPAENPALAFENGEVVMTGDGNSTGALNLGKGVVPAGNATIEIWATRTGVKKWSRVFDYGTGTSDYFMMSWAYGEDGTKDSVSVTINGGQGNINNTMLYEDNVKYHISATATVNADGSTTISWAKRDVATGEVLAENTLTQAGWTLAKLVAGNFYLGHSQFTSDLDANAKYDEVRIWRGALNAEALTLSAQKGPNATTADIAAIVAKNAETPVGRTLDLAGGTIDLGGYTLTQPNLVGNGGTVRNGTLVVTDTIRLNVGDCITASGTIDLTDANVEIVDVENLSTPFWFIKPAENGTLTVVGTPEAVNLPSGWKISASSSGAKVQKVGFTIYVR